MATGAMKCAAKVNQIKKDAKTFSSKEVCASLHIVLLCLSECRNGAFRCKTGVCLHKEAVSDKQIDCLDGEDESAKHVTESSKTLLQSSFIGFTPKFLPSERSFECVV